MHKILCSALIYPSKCADILGKGILCPLKITNITYKNYERGLNMMKHMKKAISFFMAVCLLAGNSYVNTEANTSVSMEWSEGTGEAAKPVEPLFPKGLLSSCESIATLITYPLPL